MNLARFTKCLIIGGALFYVSRVNLPLFATKVVS
jgi:hypothetical protein